MEIIDLNKENVEYLHYKRGWALSRIAKYFNVSYSKMNKFFIENNIEKQKLIPSSLFLEKFLPNCKDEDLKKEAILANKVFSKYPDLMFWKNIDLTGCNIKSIAYFMTKFGNDLIKEKFDVFNFKFPITKNIVLSDDKIGENYEINKKQNLLEFLK